MKSHRPSARSPLFRRRSLLLAAGACPLLSHAAIGGLPTNVGQTDSSPEWEKLRHAVYGDRPIDATTGTVRLSAPLRAAYGASVPIKISSLIPQTPELYVKRLQLFVDKNPSPLAATLDLTPSLGQADFETRIRVDEYSHVRVVSELSNGDLYMDSRYVKTSGGCSAPPNRDRPDLIGKTLLKVETSPPEIGQLNTADVTVVHPNDTGFELNDVTVMYIPSYFVRTIEVSYAGQKLFSTDQDFSISENPTWQFHFIPKHPGELRAEVTDSKELHYDASLQVA